MVLELSPHLSLLVCHEDPSLDWFPAQIVFCVTSAWVMLLRRYH